MPQNSLSVNVQLHSTADAGDHLTRKLMNLLLGRRKKIGAFFTFHETSSIKYDQVSSLNLTDQSVMSVVISSGSNKTVRVPWQYWEQRMATYLEKPFFLFFFFLKNALRIGIRQARFLDILQARKTSFFTPVLLWSVWPVIYLTVLLGSAGVVGFAGKAPVSPEQTTLNQSHAQELAKW